MSFKVSRVNQPEIITETFLPYLQQAGELTSHDVKQILADADQQSYQTDYAQLCAYLGLWKQVNTRFVYDLDESVLSNNQIERLFQLLARLPHFRRWLLIKYRTGNTPSVEDVTVSDEREQQFLKRRLRMLEKWDDYVCSQISRPMDELIEEYLPETMRMSDEFLFYDSQQRYTEDAEIRTTLLVLLVLAQKRGFAVALDEVAQRLSTELETLHGIIDGVFTPLAIDINAGDYTAALKSTILFSVTCLDRVEPKLAAFSKTETRDGTDIDTYMNTLAGDLIDRGVFTTTAVNVDRPHSRLQWQHEQSREKRYPDMPSPSSNELFEELWQASQRGGLVPLPDADFSQLGTFNRALAETLTMENTPTIGTPEWQFLTVIREPEIVLGPVPIFAAEQEHQLGPIGTWIQEKSQQKRNQIARTLIFLCHPAFRYLAIVACEFNDFQLTPPYRLDLAGTRYDLVEFFDHLSTVDDIEHEFILCQQLRESACKPLVKTAEWLGFLEPDPTANAYDLGRKLNKAINEYKVADTVYEEEYSKLRTVVPGVTL